jgi:DNA repair exonuclease SbcCD ATPase subunit
MITIKSLQLRNFMSFGAVAQSVELNNEDLTLILGENIDLGGSDAGSKNGVGKSTIFQGISYALFGTAINSIKKDNLINRTNEKNMSVTIEFAVRGIDYRIQRTRKPNSLKFYINNKEQSSEDDSQGDSRETQDAIERVLCMSNTMFNHIVGLNSYTTPFLSLKVAEQREVIEQLLGITLLSEKAVAVKELIKQTKDSITSEEYRVRSIDESNKRIQEQIDSLKRRQVLWQKKYDSDMAYLATNYEKLSAIDIDAELLAHKDLAIWNERKKQSDTYQSILTRQTQWKNKNISELTELERILDEKSHIDINTELQAHRDLAAWVVKSANMTQLQKYIDQCLAAEKKEQKVIDKLKAEVEELKNHKCYACGQDFHDDNHESVLATKEKALQEAALQALSTNTQLMEHTDALRALEPLGDRPVTHYKTEAEAVRHSSEIENIVKQIATKQMEIDPYAEQLAEQQEIDLGVKPTTHYKTEQEAIEHKTQVANLEAQLIEKSNEADPYGEQIVEMQETAIQVVDYSTIDELNRVMKHQDYLVDLLTNKKSFVRKRIIEQNLGYLNSRLAQYLDKMGLPHQVVFQNDLSVEITELGRDLDFDNLSRGERNRLILGLSFAFRDVFENLYSPINLLMIDELVDNGMDAVGVDNAVAVLKDFVRRRNKSVWLVSHKEELVSRIDKILTVVKENGFTSLRSQEEETDAE